MYPNYNMYNQYYGFREYNYRNSEMKEQSGEIITLNQAIDLIRKSVDDEKEDEMFYGILIEQAPTDKEKDIIVKHMWPVTLLSFPKYKESFLITIFDKRSALKSFFEYNKKQFSNTKFYRYAYIFFTGLLFRIF